MMPIPGHGKGLLMLGTCHDDDDDDKREVIVDVIDVS